ncbi:MAG: type II toxin-antitoxin system VapC family toxin [Syntrophorhabdales bacterium]
MGQFQGYAQEEACQRPYLKIEGDMIVYLDTSSLVKLYVEEEGSADVAAILKNARTAATSMIAYAEARAAFARRFREGSVTKRAYKSLLLSFEKDWINYLQVKVSQDLIRLAGDLAEKHALRGFDAIHLSSAVSLMKANVGVVFLCHDEKLQKALLREQLVQPSVRSAIQEPVQR